MVAICVRTLGQKPVECNARALLFKAHVALERGSFIECGCQLREAIRVWLFAECAHYDCLPKQKRNHQTPPRLLARALRQQGTLAHDYFNSIIELIEIGNKAAHLCFVKPEALSAGMQLVHSFLDGSPYLVQPKTGGRS